MLSVMGASLAAIDFLRKLFFPTTSVETKQAPVDPPVSFIPRDAQGNTIDSPLFGLDDSRVLVDRTTAYVIAAYCYVACRYRAEKLSEPPLMVVEHGGDGDEWIEGHEAERLLDEPSPDFDMGELQFISRIYRDTTGSCLWVKDRDRVGRVGRLTPFSGDEFTVRPRDGRIYGEFVVNTRTGSQTFGPEDVVYFRDIHPFDWWRGIGWVEVALRTLNVSEQTQATVRNLLRNALFPSVIIQTHPEWSPTDQEWDRFKAEIDEHALPQNKGRALAITGGGTATRTSFTLRDLVPDELQDRVEATVAACSGIAAVVLQFLVGLKNSPWSQMEEARRMTYEDTLDAIWKRDEKALTRQLLRDFDDDPTHLVRFDRSGLAALRSDTGKLATVASSMSKAWTVDEMRIYTGMEPLPDGDPRKDIIPDLALRSTAPEEDDEPIDDETQKSLHNRIAGMLPNGNGKR